LISYIIFIWNNPVVDRGYTLCKYCFVKVHVESIVSPCLVHVFPIKTWIYAVT
jgi:hypothetical protein